MFPSRKHTITSIFPNLPEIVYTFSYITFMMKKTITLALFWENNFMKFKIKSVRVKWSGGTEKVI